VDDSRTSENGVFGGKNYWDEYGNYLGSTYAVDVDENGNAKHFIFQGKQHNEQQQEKLQEQLQIEKGSR
jgi:hypothetical protein